MRFHLVSAALAPLTLLAACGLPSAEDAREASIAKCDRQFGRMAPDAAKGAAFCGCLVDKLSEEGLEITDMMGGERERVMQTTRSCAQAHGVPIVG
ncbi:MAG: hypothetical protein AAGJ50_13880 [Pseudomonadota bacterium]